MLCTIQTLQLIAEKYSELTVLEFIELLKKGEVKYESYTS